LTDARTQAAHRVRQTARPRDGGRRQCVDRPSTRDRGADGEGRRVEPETRETARSEREHHQVPHARHPRQAWTAQPRRSRGLRAAEENERLTLQQLTIASSAAGPVRYTFTP